VACAGVPISTLPNPLAKWNARDQRNLEAVVPLLCNELHPQSRIVELGYFAGLTAEETAAVLDVSPATVKRDWSMARAWLSRQIKRGEGGNKAGMGKN